MPRKRHQNQEKRNAEQKIIFLIILVIVKKKSFECALRSRVVFDFGIFLGKGEGVSPPVVLLSAVVRKKLFYISFFICF